MPETSQERTEEATPRRRQQARRKGTVAKSQDLTGAVVAVALLIALPPALGNLGVSFKDSLREGWSSMPQTVDPQAIGGYLATSVAKPLYAFLPIVLTALVAGLAINFAQVGFVFSTEAMAPSLAKVNPLEGIKRMLSFRATLEGFKAFAKAVLFGWIAYSVVQGNYPQLLSLSWVEPSTSLGLVGSVLREIGLKVAFCWLAIAVGDYLYQRKNTDKQLRMTKEELKQEMKEMEGSPELKAAIAQRRRKLTRRMMESVKTADAIITNPTHFSVAIKYDPATMHAPQVVAKGMDLVALRIREVAGEHRVPIVPNPPLARQLFKKCEVGDPVPRELFQAVAEVLAYVYRTLRAIA